MTCHEVDRLITPFIDGECTSAERTAVTAHLNTCHGCRTRFEAESTAQHVLHAHAAIARTMGVPPPWRPRVFRLGQPSLPVHPAILLVSLVVGAGVLAAWLRPTPVMAVGIVSDSVCADGHRFSVRTDDRQCTLGCVKRGAEFVLVTDQQIYRIRNQQLPALFEFANVRVAFKGTLDGDRLIVTSVAPANRGE